ncbi:MAG: tetratricopeptide repeat protein [Spirochaetaceae bacterium]|jgi:tetratricopeptide (TPR) repeat protein|nr:tetratricopeptide repeat protein [Spirochaetaceae bacterium]
MKIKKEFFIGLMVVIITVSLIGGIYTYQKIKARNSLIARIKELSPQDTPPRTIENLREAIRLYEELIEQHIRDAAQTGVYWKLLATRLQDRGLHHEALDALERAVYYTPEDAYLHYLRGLSAAVAAKSSFDPPEGTAKVQQYYDLSEMSYLRAIELDEGYGRPRYGIGVLYVFELNRPEDAIPHLLRYLEISRNDVDAMFVLARAYYMVNNYQGALDMYDRIITTSRDAAKRFEAENNRQIILDSYYG